MLTHPLCLQELKKAEYCNMVISSNYKCPPKPDQTEVCITMISMEHFSVHTAYFQLIGIVTTANYCTKLNMRTS